MKILSSLVEIVGSLILSNSQYQAKSNLFLDINKKVISKQLPFVFPGTEDIQIVATRGTQTRVFESSNNEAINLTGDMNRGVSQKFYRDEGEITYQLKNSSNNVEDCIEITAYRSRGTFIAPSPVAASDGILYITPRGYDGVQGFQDRGGIRFMVDQNVAQSAIAGNNMPTAIRFRTGSINTQDRATINANGNVGIGITSAITAKFHVNGNCAIGYPDIQAIATNAVSVGGGSVYTGSGANFFKVLGTRQTGFRKTTGASTKTMAAFNTSTVTLAKLTEMHNAIYDALVSHGLLSI